ncbi:MAG: neutral/alkaline non-lysosomal ceramidase N-terminal domain-containing protein [Spirochaetaceae bacterium]|nr:neutral/alkaline non-lysosomal ceramidase N-terminal domain-containing protein [Spirochaetaceae bacterium]
MSSLHPYHPPSARCRAGVARRDVTPPVGIQSRSFGAALHETAEGVHRPFTATALALAELESDGSPMLLLAVDIGWLEKEEMAEFLDGVREPLGLDEGRLLIAFSHTHAGANLSSSMRDHPGGDKIRPYFERLIARCAEAGAEAIANLVPAWLTFGSGTCDLAQNRDAWDEDSQQFVTGFNPDGEADDTVLVARVSGDDGSVLATLVNYGCHPTTLGPANRLLSPDYIGAMREVMEDAFGAPCLFLLSPCGDTGPREGFVGDTSVADSNGRRLGFAAAAAVESLLPAGTQLKYDGPIISGATLGAWKRTKLDLPADDRSFALRSRTLRIDLPIKPHESPDALKAAHDEATRDLEAAQASADPIAIRNATALRERARRRHLRGPTLPDGGTIPFDLHLWQLGDAFLLSVPAEPYSLLQSELRSRFPGRPLLISVVTNGTLAYLLPRDLYGNNLYQDWVSFPGPGGMELVLETAAAAIPQ